VENYSDRQKQKNPIFIRFGYYRCFWRFAPLPNVLCGKFVLTTF